MPVSLRLYSQCTVVITGSDIYAYRGLDITIQWWSIEPGCVTILISFRFRSVHKCIRLIDLAIIVFSLHGAALKCIRSYLDSPILAPLAPHNSCLGLTDHDNDIELFKLSNLTFKLLQMPGMTHS